MNIVDVFSLDEANEKLEWHARNLAINDGKDPNALVYLMGRDKAPLPEWMAYLPEAKRFMIGLEAWFGNHGRAFHHGNGRVIEDAELVGTPGESAN